MRWEGEGSQAELALSLNLHRRHLDESQRALVAAVTVASDHAHGELVLQTVEREASELLGPQLVSAVVEWL